MTIDAFHQQRLDLDYQLQNDTNDKFIDRLVFTVVCFYIINGKCKFNLVAITEFIFLLRYFGFECMTKFMHL